MNHDTKLVPEEAVLASQETRRTAILVPTDKPYNESYYILALENHLGLVPLEFPAAVLHNGIHYPFDFYSYANDCVVKILWNLDRNAMKQVQMLKEFVDVVVIVDTEKARCNQCCGCDSHNFCERAVAAAIEIGARASGYKSHNRSWL